MDVCNNRNVNFNGIHIKNTNVLKRVAKEVNEYVPTEAHIVEMDYNNPKDKKAVDDLFKYWQGAEFIPMIASYTTSPTRRVYAITRQANDFENMDSSKIMGMVDYKINGNSANVSFLQADPKYLDENPRSVKGIGKSLMQGTVEHLKETHGCTEMKGFARPTEKPFYRKIFPNLVEKPSTQDDYTNMSVEL